MSEATGAFHEDAYLNRLKKARSSRTVVKTEFAAKISCIPDGVFIFAFEGVADKLAYYYWLKSVGFLMAYESYTCDGKIGVLKLYDSLVNDRTGLGERVWYFIDKDFDGLAGRVSNGRIFVTDKYSIENYVVDSQLLNDMLCVDFHCHGLSAVRLAVLEIFFSVYGKFLQITKELNFKIYLGKKLGQIRSDELPKGINQLAIVDLCEVRPLPGSGCLSDLVTLAEEPNSTDLEKFREQFDLLMPESDYRGKFALLFFLKWLSLLREDRLSQNPKIFKDIPAPSFAVKGGFSFEGLIAKANPPAGLKDFLALVS